MLIHIVYLVDASTVDCVIIVLMIAMFEIIGSTCDIEWYITRELFLVLYALKAFYQA